MNTSYNSRLQMKTDTEANWNKAVNFIPLKGEICFYSDLNKIKVGDGIALINDLEFLEIQSNWNQNDPQAKDYIKNRPGGYIYDAITLYDGTMAFVDDGIGEISNLDPIPTMFEVGAVYEIVIDARDPYVQEAVLNDDGEIYVGDYENDLFSFSNSKWLIDAPGYYDIKISIPEGIAKIPSKYLDIPEQIQSDWDETDETSKAFIKNKPTIFENALIVTATIEGINLAGEYYGSADYNAEQIWNEVCKGRAIYLRADIGTGEFYLPLMYASSDTAQFKYLTSLAIVTSDSNAYVYYDGELPTVTSEDDGKFLRVVNGSWAAVAVPSAEEVSF